MLQNGVATTASNTTTCHVKDFCAKEDQRYFLREVSTSCSIFVTLLQTSTVDHDAGSLLCDQQPSPTHASQSSTAIIESHSSRLAFLDRSNDSSGVLPFTSTATATYEKAHIFCCCIHKLSYTSEAQLSSLLQVIQSNVNSS